MFLTLKNFSIFIATLINHSDSLFENIPIISSASALKFKLIPTTNKIFSNVFKV